jgi:hypothetical protein
MPDGCTGFVVDNLSSVRPLLATIVRPPQYSGQDVLWTLQPFETDTRSCRRFRLAVLYCPFGKSGDIIGAILVGRELLPFPRGAVFLQQDR